MTRKLKVFLCHASQDKPAVRELYKRLAAESWIEPWLDEENLLPGQDFDLEIYKATRDSDAIIICLSKVSVAKEGYVNKEIRRALDISQEKPEGTIYVIPLRLDECNPSFEYLRKLHWVDYFKQDAHQKLVKALRLRADNLKIETSETNVESVVEAKPIVSHDDVDLDLYRFVQIPATEEVHYSFYIGKYPITNAQYERFLNAPDFANRLYWLEFPKFDESCEPIGDWGTASVDWLKEKLEESESKVLLPRDWNKGDFGISNPNNPVVGISWYEACAYCEWLFQNWDSLSEGKANFALTPKTIRLPLETEWVTAAGGEVHDGRYPWDEAGKVTILLKDKLRRSNISDSRIGHTTPVNAYPLGQSPFGVMDMAGNVWEWQVNYQNMKKDWLGLRGGSWYYDEKVARVSIRYSSHPDGRSSDLGFRVVLLPSG